MLIAWPEKAIYWAEGSRRAAKVMQGILLQASPHGLCSTEASSCVTGGCVEIESSLGLAIVAQPAEIA